MFWGAIQSVDGDLLESSLEAVVGSARVTNRFKCNKECIYRLGSRCCRRPIANPIASGHQRTCCWPAAQAMQLYTLSGLLVTFQGDLPRFGNADNIDMLDPISLGTPPLNPVPGHFQHVSATGFGDWIDACNTLQRPKPLVGVFFQFSEQQRNHLSPKPIIC